MPAFAGHSFGAVTTLLAAGAVLEMDYTNATGSHSVTVDLEDEGFSRVGSGPSPFIDADAFLMISGGMNVTEHDLAVWDQTSPAFHGKDYVQRPLMMALGGNDLITDNTVDRHLPFENGFQPENTDWMNPVTKAYDLNDAPAYGVVIDGANHITPVSQFKGFSSAQCGVLWTDVIYPILENFGMSGTKILTDKEDTTSDEDTYLKDNLFADLAIRWLEGKFPEELAVQEQEEPLRLENLATYTLNFWDVHLSPEYDFANGALAAAFLSFPDKDHMDFQYVRDNVGFRHSTEGAFVVRDATGKSLVQFQPDGYLSVLWGDVYQNSIITQNPSATEFIVRDTSGAIAAKVDAATGNLYLKGSLAEEVDDLRTSANPEFVVRDAVEIKYQGDDTKAKHVLSTSGNLRITGTLNPLAGP